MRSLALCLPSGTAPSPSPQQVCAVANPQGYVVDVKKGLLSCCLDAFTSYKHGQECHFKLSLCSESHSTYVKLLCKNSRHFKLQKTPPHWQHRDSERCRPGPGLGGGGAPFQFATPQGFISQDGRHLASARVGVTSNSLFALLCFHRISK
jgi:hypothetical protein